MLEPKIKLVSISDTHDRKKKSSFVYFPPDKRKTGAHPFSTLNIAQDFVRIASSVS